MKSPDYVRAFLAKAEEALAAARLNNDMGLRDVAVNRAYYAAFYTARAALLQIGESPRSHKGVGTRFAERFVRAGLVDRSIGGILEVAERSRLKADYDAFAVFDAKAVDHLISDVERFIGAVQALIERAS
jgi:uncharacterized protein (UPF0332 family)